MLEAIIKHSMENNIQHSAPSPVSMLSTVPGIFRNFSPEFLRGILDTARFVSVDAGQHVKPDSLTNALEGYLITDGRLAAIRHGQTIEIYNPGDFVGESFLHSKVFMECELVALDPCHILVFDRVSTLLFFRDKPEKLLKIFTINVVEAQQKHICALYKRIGALMKEMERIP
jgi:CRP-like cAMP-binding protein